MKKEDGVPAPAAIAVNPLNNPVNPDLDIIGGVYQGI